MNRNDDLKLLAEDAKKKSDAIKSLVERKNILQPIKGMISSDGSLQPTVGSKLVIKKTVAKAIESLESLSPAQEISKNKTNRPSNP